MIIVNVIIESFLVIEYFFTSITGNLVIDLMGLQFDINTINTIIVVENIFIDNSSVLYHCKMFVIDYYTKYPQTPVLLTRKHNINSY